ncbi:MAG TPA: universal stress protein [Gaiellaceae bacterium]|nr:universal stress protein [Gaiellaceae bacterium]
MSAAEVLFREQTPQSLEALRQALRLRIPAGSVHLVAVAPIRHVVHAELIGEILRTAEESLRLALADVGGETARVVEGDVTQGLLSEIARERATLVALGIKGHSRAAGIYLGSTTTALLRKAPCSVLVARPAAQPDSFPRRIVLGLDGSPQSFSAAGVARDLVERFGAELQALAALRGKPIDADRLALQASELGLQPERVERPPTDALVAASSAADLLVVGSRGLHGLRSLGSVSERVAHRGRCSVLVVRTPTPARQAISAHPSATEPRTSLDEA